ncbi:MAG: tetratricopeptide repeat protein [Terriglobia bacterium]
MRRSLTLGLALSLLALVFLAGCSKLRARDELNKGVRAYKAGEFETAVEHFQRAIQLDPSLINARLYLARAYTDQFVPGSPSDENKKRGEAAVRWFENVLEIDPQNVIALSSIASLYYGMARAESDWEKARGLFEKSKELRRRVIEVEPENPEHYYWIGAIDWGIAYRPRNELRTSLKLRPDQPLPRRQRRQLAEQNSEVVDEGIQALEKALEINPKYVDAMTYLNLLYREKADIVDSPKEREHFLQLADQWYERQKRLREQIQEAPAAS